MILRHLPNIDRRARKVAIGVFDGVHCGHQKVIQGNDTVLTFDPHPLAILRPGSEPEKITTLADRIELFEQLGVEETIVLPFDQHYAQMSAHEFVEKILIEQLDARAVTVGKNFRFGRDAGGDADLLASYDAFSSTSVPLDSTSKDLIISSTYIREALKKGDIAVANTMLGRYWSVKGIVIQGDQRGRELGFPTANLELVDRMVCPRFGIYAGRVGDHLAAINVGVRPTFEAAGRLLVEVFILDWKKELYGQELEVQFVEFLRDEEKFDSVDALISQMGKDVERVREIFRG